MDADKPGECKERTASANVRGGVLVSSPELLRQSSSLLASHHFTAHPSPTLAKDASACFPAAICWSGSWSFAFPPLLFCANPAHVPVAQPPFPEAAGRMARCCCARYQSDAGCWQGPGWGSTCRLQAQPHLQSR